MSVETNPAFVLEMTLDKAYLRRTWQPLARLKRTRWLLALLPAACLVYALCLWAGGKTVQMGIPIMAAIFLLFALMLPSLALSQLLSQYRQYQADGPRRISLLSDGVETELTKYHNTVFHAYRDFERVEEDEFSYSLVRQGQRVIIPKGPCLVGDPAQVKAFLEARLAACRAEAEAEDQESGEEAVCPEDEALESAAAGED